MLCERLFTGGTREETLGAPAVSSDPGSENGTCQAGCGETRASPDPDLKEVMFGGHWADSALTRPRLEETSGEEGL